MPNRQRTDDTTGLRKLKFDIYRIIGRYKGSVGALREDFSKLLQKQLNTGF